MNFRTVRTIRRGLRRGESGQAFTELAVSLFAILAAFVGFLLVAAVSSDRVSALVNARENADERARDNRVDIYSSAGDARSISYRTYGADGLPFTADDEIVQGAAGNGGVFMDELADNSGNVNLANSPASWQSDFSTLRDTEFFVNAATLVTGEGTPHGDTLRKHNIDSLRSSIAELFSIGDIDIRERVYMPAHNPYEGGN